jgi:hypothetical protein
MVLVLVIISMSYHSKYLVNCKRIDDHYNVMMHFKSEPTPHSFNILFLEKFLEK